MTHFNDDDSLLVWHRLNEVHRTKALQYFLETPQWHAFAQPRAYIDFMHATRQRAFLGPSNCFNKGAKTSMEVRLPASRIGLSRGGVRV
jgi:hypothetical protein